MTLIIAADVQDHLFLAGDHCATMSWVSNPGPPDVVLDNFQKIYPWKYGAIAATGDVLLMVCFHQLFLDCESRGRPIDLLHIARLAKQVRSRSGARPEESTGNIFLTLPGCIGFELHALYIDEARIDHEVIEAVSTRFSMPGRPLDDSACHVFTGHLRPSFFFLDVDAFHRHHLDLLGAFFAEKGATDRFVTSSFDAFMLDKRSGVGMFWKTPHSVKPLVSIVLPVGDGKHAPVAEDAFQWIRDA